MKFQINFFNMPNKALLFKSSGRLFHILRSAYEGRYPNEPVFRMPIWSFKISKIFKSVVKWGG